MTTTTQPLLTTEDLLAMPEDGVERDLIRGQLRERPMTRRNRRHSRAEARITYFLMKWLEQQPEPRGEVLVGEAGVRLRQDPDTTVGIDVAYISAAVASGNADDAALVEGPPVLAVEVLSPSDKHEDIVLKVISYLDAGVPLVWVVDPSFRTVLVYRPDAEPELFNVNDELAGDPHLPGLRLSVRAIF